MNANAGTDDTGPQGAIEQRLQTRWSLIERLKDWDDQTGWRDFFQTYRGLIYGVAIKAGLTDSEAQEVVQETVIAVAKKMPDFKCDPAAGSFKGFLLQITGRRIADQFRKRARAAAPTPWLDQAPPGAVASASRDDGSRTATVERVPDPAGDVLERLWDEEWQKHVMQAALERVKRQADPEQFQMFELHVLRQLPVSEVADKLGVNAAQVYFAKYKISRLLRKESARLEKQSLRGK
jgi:RNA polymerase sigma-70 factor (ECF subfamily)